MDNQDQQPPITQLEQQTPPSSPESGKNKYIIMGVIGLVSLLLLAIVSIFVAERLGKDPLGGLINPGFTDWLKPESEINIGTNRYVSPCQALPQDEVTKLYGDFGPTGYIMEDYADQSPTDSVRDVGAYCSYELDNNAIASVELKTTQYRDAGEMKRLGSVMGLVDVADAEAALADYTKLVGDSDNKDAQKLLDRFSSSVATYKKYDSVYDEKALADLKTDGLLIPSEESVTLVQGNVAYVFSYTPKPVTEKPSSEQLISYVARLMTTVEGIEDSVRDTALSQSPARTVIGKTDMVGSTKLLESCAVLTPGLFSSIAGREQNDLVHRLSAVADSNKERFAKVDKSVLLPYSSCERKYNRYNDASAAPTAQNVTIGFELKYAKSEAAAIDWLTTYYPDGQDSAPIETRADWAQQITRTDLLDETKTTNFYMFRVGPYIGSVDIRLLMSEGLTSEIVQTEGTTKQHIRAINELVDSLKAHLKKAQ